MLSNSLPRCLNRVEVRILTWPFQPPDICPLKPFGCQFACTLEIIVLVQDTISALFKLLVRWPHICLKRILVYYIISMTASFPGLVAAKQSQIIKLSTTMLDSWYEVFGKKQTQHINKHGIVHDDQTSPHWSHQSKRYCYRTCLIKYNFANLSLAAIFLLARRRVFPSHPPAKAVLVRFFSDCAIMKINI